MKQNGSTLTRSDRLNTIAKQLQELREAEHQRRIRAGAQLVRDHDHSARYQPKRLPTYNP